MQNKNYRPNVAAIVLSSSYPEKCEIFVASRVDIANSWQFPQGGIDNDETPEETLYRELEEEIGTNDIEIIAQYPHWISYDFPEHILSKMKPFCGQTQRYFLVKLNKNAKINLQTKHPEFDAYKFIDLKDTNEHISSFKKTIYNKVLDYFTIEGYLK